MPTAVYYNPAATQPQASTNSPSFRGQEKNDSNKITRDQQKNTQRELSNLQKNAPRSPGNLPAAASSPRKMLSAALNILKQIDLTEDWKFLFILTPFALLKDIFDIAFAGVPGVGIIIQFVTELMLMILAVTVLLLSGSGMKNRGMAKYFLGMAVAFMSEALPGIGWLPLSVVESLLLYLFVLYDRAQEEPKPAQQET